MCLLEEYNHLLRSTINCGSVKVISIGFLDFRAFLAQKRRGVVWVGRQSILVLL